VNSCQCGEIKTRIVYCIVLSAKVVDGLDGPVAIVLVVVAVQSSIPHVVTIAAQIYWCHQPTANTPPIFHLKLISAKFHYLLFIRFIARVQLVGIDTL